MNGLKVATTSRKSNITQEVIELQHLTGSPRCICGAEFCYLCGSKWKTCECASWGERDLLHQADDVHDQEREFWLQWAVDNNVEINDDGVIEEQVLVPAPAVAAAEDAFEPAGDREVVPDPPEGYVDELVHAGGPFETMEDCEHPEWQFVEVGGQGQPEHYIPCDLCAQDQPFYLIRCRQCGLRICLRCGRHRFAVALT